MIQSSTFIKLLAMSLSTLAMINTRALLTWIVSSLALTCLVRAEVLDTWIIAGQSNAEGYGITEKPVPGLASQSTLSDIGRNALNVTHSNIQMFQGANDYNGITVSAGMTLPPKNTWHTMNAQEGLAYDWGGGRGGESGRRFGPELAFGYDVQAQIGAPIAIIKYARGSASIASSTTQNGTIWLDFDPSDGGRLNHYDKLITTIQTAVNNLPAGRVLNVRGVVWMQGESDATATFAHAYQANLTEFITTLRTDIGTIAAASGGKMTRSASAWSKLDVFLGTVQNSNAYRQTVIDAQNAVAAAVANVFTVNATTGLSMMTVDDWGASGVHYDTAGQVLLGERFADAALARVLLDNGAIKTPTTASGGTGSAAHVQTDDDVNYTVAKGQTASIGGFGTHDEAITSVYLFVQYSVETGYTGTNAIQVNGVDTTIVPALRDYGRWARVDITGGSFGINTSAEIEALTVSFNNNDATPSNAVLFDCVYVVVNRQTAIHAPPTWSEDFNGTGPANPMVWQYEVGVKRNPGQTYYVAGASNGWQEGGSFVIEGRKESVGGSQYTTAGILTQDKYYWKYGRAQIRAKIPCFRGMWPAIWGTGEVGQWPHNGEVDIMEYYRNNTLDYDQLLANCAVGTATEWGTKWDDVRRPITSLTDVDPNWKTQWHIWTMQWDEQNIRLYVDNVLMNTIPQSWLKNTDGYNTTWGPQYPFISNGMNCWLNLAIGDAGGDPTATMNSGPQRFFIDYWRIWENATNNVAPTDIAVSGSGVLEGQAIGTVVGNLSATDADPAEVHRYTLVAGTGDTHNSQFTIPEFVSDNTTLGVIKTAAVLNYFDGATRSIRVRVTDIEGLTYDKVITINVSSSGQHVTYNGNGSDGGSVPIDPVGYPQGTTVTVRGNTGALTQTGFAFVGWNTAANGGGTTYSGGNTFAIGATDVTLYAKWNAVPTYTVSYNGNSHSSGTAPGNQTKTQGVNLALATNSGNLARTGYTFAGWNTSPGGTGTNYAVGANYTADAAVTLYAKWNSLPVANAGVTQTVYLSAGQPWTPTELSLAAWYDASDATTITPSSGAVTQWRDKTSANNHMAVGGGNPMTGTHTINSRNAIDFSSDYFMMGSAINMLGKSAFLSLESDSFLANQILIGNSGANVQLRIDIAGTLRYAAADPYYPTAAVSTSLLATGQPSVIGYLLDANMKFSVDGTHEDPGAANDGSGETNFNLIGTRTGSSTNYFDGRIGEIVITNALPTISDRQKIEGYLAHKWGTTAKLSTSPAHPYYRTAPTTTSATAILAGSTSDPEGSALTTTWSMPSGPGTVTFSNALALNSTATFSVAGTYTLRLTVSDGLGQSTSDVVITVSLPTPYSTWSAGTFLNPPFTNNGPNSNPDGDAFNNLQEFAFGMDPTDSTTRPISYVEGGALTASGTPFFVEDGTTNLAVFTRRKDHVSSGLTYSVWFSADLVNWTQSGDTPTIRTSATDPGNYEAVSVPYPTSVPTPKFFKIGVVSN